MGHFGWCVEVVHRHVWHCEGWLEVGVASASRRKASVRVESLNVAHVREPTVCCACCTAQEQPRDIVGGVASRCTDSRCPNHVAAVVACPERSAAMYADRFTVVTQQHRLWLAKHPPGCPGGITPALVVQGTGGKCMK